MAVVVMGERNVISWGTTNFVRYYMEKYRELQGDSDYKFPSHAWLMYGTHIKRFRSKIRVTNEVYRDFIDWVFSPEFRQSGEVVGFMAIVSVGVWHYYQRVQNATVKHVVSAPTASELRGLYDRLHATPAIFPTEGA